MTPLEAGVQYDPTGVDNLHDCLDPGAAEAALPIVSNARRDAEEAIALAETDEYAALSVWYELFGDPFPEPPTQSVEDAFSNSLTGGLTTTGIATVSDAARVSPRRCVQGDPNDGGTGGPQAVAKRIAGDPELPFVSSARVVTRSRRL